MKRGINVLLCAALAGLLTCTRYNSTNPVDPGCRGDYALVLDMSSSILPDTPVMYPY